MAPAAGLERVHSRLRLRHLVFIQALAKHGNIRRAACELFVSQPAASKLLQEIETAFGAQLYERSAHGIAPTAVGEIVVHWSQRALAQMSAAQREVEALCSGADGRVRIGVFPVAATALVPQAIAVLRAQASSIALHLREGLEDTLVPALSRGELDCVVGRLTPPLRHRALAYEVLCDEPTVVVCGPGHPLARSWDVESLCHFEWMLPSSGAALYTLVANGLASLGQPAPRIAVETTSIQTIVHTLGKTDLLGAVPSQLAVEYAASGLLAILPFVLNSGLHPVCVMTAVDGEVNPATRQFIKVLREVADARADPVVGS